MDKNFMIAIIAVVIVGSLSILGYEYLESKDNKIMAESGLEQCAKSPDWSNSGVIWVRSCDKYMTNFAKNFKDD